MKTKSQFLHVFGALALAAWLGLSGQAFAEGDGTDTSTKENTNIITQAEGDGTDASTKENTNVIL